MRPPGEARSLSGPWLAVRLGIDPVALEARRRAGELHAIRPERSPDWLFPAWQFDAEGHVRPEVARILEAARRAQLRGDDLDAVLRRRVGLTDRRRLLDLLLQGDERPVLEAIESARRGD